MHRSHVLGAEGAEAGAAVEGTKPQREEDGQGRPQDAHHSGPPRPRAATGASRGDPIQGASRAPPEIRQQRAGHRALQVGPPPRAQLLQGSLRGLQKHHARDSWIQLQKSHQASFLPSPQYRRLAPRHLSRLALECSRHGSDTSNHPSDLTNGPNTGF